MFNIKYFRINIKNISNYGKTFNVIHSIKANRVRKIHVYLFVYVLFV